MIVYGADADICRWVSQGLSRGNEFFDQDSKALGVMRDGKLIAGVVYHNYHPGLLIEMSIFSVDKRWCLRHNLKAIFCYPFIQLDLERTQAICSANNEGVHMFLEKVGFTREGYHRKAYHDGSDAVSFGMLRDDCKWLGGN